MSLNQDLGTHSLASKPDSPFSGDMLKLARSWARDTASILAKNADRAKYEGQIQWQVRDDEIVFSFPAYMRYRDMKLLFWAKMPNVEAIQNWVEKKGVNRFAYVPGYNRSNEGALSTAPDAARRIAYGVAFAMARTGEPVNNWSRYRRKKIWQNPKSGKRGKDNLGTRIGYLTKLVEEELAAITSNQIIYTLTQIV